LPTCVRDYAKPLKQYKGDNVIRIGWVGSSYNLRNIEAVFSQLETLYERTAFEFILICDKVTTIHTTFPLRFIKWSEDAEVENLLQIDIGLMPLFRNDTARGKAAFKLIQYMSLGIVSVASAVTINTDIIEDGANGYLVEDETKWVEVLDMVIRSRSQFAQIGEAAYSRISNTYTFDANEATYLSFIKQQLTGA
jgi:glycosyltransferase involved in cell wall biosynthesis